MSDVFLVYYLHKRIDELNKAMRAKNVEPDEGTDTFIRGGIHELEHMLKIIEQRGWLSWEDGP